MKLTYNEAFIVTINAGLLAIFYTGLGVVISYFLYHIFDEYNEEWQKKSAWFKISDVTIEVVVIGIVAFWSSRAVEIMAPFIPVRKELDRLVDGYISGIFFVFAMFVFLDSLSEKVRHLQEQYFAHQFENLLPKHGSLVDLSLSYFPVRKTD